MWYIHVHVQCHAVAADLQVLDGLSGGVQVLTQLAACGSIVVQLLHNSTTLQRYIHTGKYAEIHTGEYAEIHTGEYAEIHTGDSEEIHTGEYAEIHTGDSEEIHTGEYAEIHQHMSTSVLYCTCPLVLCEYDNY